MNPATDKFLTFKLYSSYIFDILDKFNCCSQLLVLYILLTPAHALCKWNFV